MSSRKERRERLRREREQRERAAREAERRRRWRGYAAGGVLVVGVLAVVVAAIAAGGGGASNGSTGAGQASPALQTGAPPWPPETGNLPTRLAALDLPPEGESYHAHAVMRVFVDGKQVDVPANIGIDPGSGTMAALHTHDDSGKIHMEAAEPYTFTLDQFFTVWGVEFSRQQVGGLKVTSGKKLEVFANGRPVDPLSYALKDGDKLVVAYGRPGSAPRSFS